MIENFTEEDFVAIAENVGLFIKIEEIYLASAAKMSEDLANTLLITEDQINAARTYQARYQAAKWIAEEIAALVKHAEAKHGTRN